MIARSFVSLLLCVPLASGIAWAAETAPDVLVKNVTNQVLSILRQDKGIQSGNRQRAIALIETKVAPHFDFTRMTRFAVGRAWHQADPAQRTALVKQFRTLLVRTYANALNAFQAQTVSVKPSANEGGEVTVHSQINQSGSQPIALDYSLSDTSDGWKVFDVMIAKVSLVTNSHYRSNFARDLETGGVERVIKSLQEKNRYIEAESHPAA